VGVRWQDWISSEEAAKRCLKMIQDKLRQKRLQWFGNLRRETDRGRSVEISGGNGGIVEKEIRKTRENVERYSEDGFGTNRSG